MLKNYLAIALRSLWRTKGHAFINVLGLSLAIACCILIVLFVKDEWTFDTFHSKADRIYRVFVKEDYGADEKFFNTSSPFPMGPELVQNFEEVESYARVTVMGAQVRTGDDQFSQRLVIADSTFFSVFDFEVIQGERLTALNNANHVVLSRKMAHRYFGDQEAINKTIAIQLGDDFHEFLVKAVAEDVPSNSSINFDILISSANLTKIFNPRLLTSAWFHVDPETYVLLREAVDADALQQKFPPVFRAALGEEDFNSSHYLVGLQPITDIHLNKDFPVSQAPVSDPKYSYILAVIALLILFVACINFVTLSIGRSLKRAREVGVRKVAGAVRIQLITQFVGEAMIVTCMALIVGVLMAALSLPLFNTLSGKQLLFPFDSFMFLVLLSLVVIIGLIAGSYPAFVLSSFRPITILKGTGQGVNSRQGMRRVLVGIQLALSVFLISSTLVMQKQLDFLRNKNLGFNKEQTAVIPLNVPRGGRMVERVNKGFEKAEQMKTLIAGIPEVVSVSVASHDFGNGAWTEIGYTDDNGTYRNFNLNIVDDEFLSSMQVSVVSGRLFSPKNPSDIRRAVVVNEAFVRAYGWSNAIGERLPGKNFADHEIIGVVKDFNYESLYTPVEPLVMVMDATIVLSGSENVGVDNSPVPKLFVRILPGKINSAIEKISQIWEKNTGGEEFNFSFIDESLNYQYRSDNNLGKIVSIATLLAVVIGSLGLYGLAALSMQNRVKEISIRKVLGATEQSLLILLSKDYAYLIAVALVLSIPATVYVMHAWLETFQYRVPIGAGVFFASGGISVIIALLTISYQTLKTAWTQPAITLKCE